MTSPLIPALEGRRLSVDVALQQPSIIRARIAALADEQILLPKFFSPLGGAVAGGGLLYSVLAASDYYTADQPEQRAPGSEYAVVRGVEPEPKLAPLEDWGGKFAITDEERHRNLTSALDQRVTQLSNVITRRLDLAALAALEAAEIGSVAGHDWDSLMTVGPLDQLTPGAARPLADLSLAQLAADEEEMGVVHDTLVVHPEQAHALRRGYGELLGAALDTAGVTLFSNPRIQPGVAWAVASGQVGTVGFERPLTTETWDDRSIRSTWVQSYAVPAFAVERPYAAKKLVGLAA